MLYNDNDTKDIEFIQRDRPDWDTYFLNLAQVIKTRSLDPKTQVGAVLVSLKTNRIISTGYNSTPAGLDDKLINWYNRVCVKTVVIHAEMNVLLYAGSNFEESILYTTMSPCSDCIKLLASAKIKKCIYINEYKDIDLVKNLCLFFGIELIKK